MLNNHVILASVCSLTFDVGNIVSLQSTFMQYASHLVIINIAAGIINTVNKQIGKLERGNQGDFILLVCEIKTVYYLSLFCRAKKLAKVEACLYA